jgi:hypothetical protein
MPTGRSLNESDADINREDQPAFGRDFEGVLRIDTVRQLPQFAAVLKVGNMCGGEVHSCLILVQKTK